jgi:hypothetical protein
MVTLFPLTHLVVCEIEGDGRDCCGAISLEDAGECSVDVARARLRNRRSCAPAEGVEGVKLTAAAVILRLRSLAGAQAHEIEVLAGSSWITSDDAATTPTRVPTGPTVFSEHLQLPPLCYNSFCLSLLVLRVQLPLTLFLVSPDSLVVWSLQHLRIL